MNKCYNSCAWEMKEKITDTHHKCDFDQKSSFVKGESEFRVCQYMSRRLKGINIPRKRVCQVKLLKSVHIEVGDRKVTQLVRE
eukprot:9462546-Ditylum_brightwellii.AAC.1